MICFKFPASKIVKEEIPIKNIFRQYDIRGIMGQEITDEIFENIIRAFALYSHTRGEKTIVIGHDNRKSSPALHKIAVNALLNSGFNIIDLGLVITPMFYFAARHLDIKAGIMITASHNPPEYNGLKLWFGESTIYGEQIQEIRKLAEKKEFLSPQKGSIKKIDIFPEYSSMIQNKIKLGPRKLKIALDCGNGTASLFAPEIYRQLGCEVIELYCKSDPDFPNHHPDPVDPKNMQDLALKVKEIGADFGIGIDGDGDRIGIVDDRGELLWGDMLMILFWRDILPRYPGTPAIIEVKCSQSLIDEINRLGGKPIMYKTGHSLIKAKMKEIGAVFTGEMSGHMFFADNYYGFDDAVYAGARFIELVSHKTETVSQMLSDVPKYHATPEIRIKSIDEKKWEIVEKARKHFKKKYKTVDIDGVRVIFSFGWGLIRASNTGPELIVRCEADSEENLEKIKEEIFFFLENVN
ncbi:phosphomannomutase/phosphoglucomutase [Thermosyntropha sp.]|uniref:phosphomannomutase/phosphoglucomutase n=1 Tax=Thermosyntropha sp. TaxID=2740820 RepID=UPI0025F190BC|nr:phosphomannomutase/phosphoglucomutase [Thermosyntropha sp.]MBO8159916.1 phosphomannomutase/phosphoglucomutase [Thermosyntropha sp.]